MILMLALQETNSVRPAADFCFLRLPRCRSCRRPVRPDPRLRRNIQLLGAYPLPFTWIRSANLGVFARLCYPKLVIHRLSCVDWQHQEAFASSRQGDYTTRMAIGSLLTCITGCRVLLRPLWSGFGVRNLPDYLLSGHCSHP